MASVRYLAGKGYRIEWSLTIKLGPDAGRKIRGSQLVRSPKPLPAMERLARQIAERRTAEARQVVYGLQRPRTPIARFISDYRAARSHNRSVGEAVAALKKFADLCHIACAAEVTPEAVLRFADALRAEGRSDCSLRHSLGHLSAAIAWGHRRRLIDRNPFAEGLIELPPKPQAREKFLERQDLARLARVCRAMPATGGATGRDRELAMQFLWHAFFMVNTGLRIEEYVTARQSDLRADRLTVWGKGKGGNKKRRTIPLNRRALQALSHLAGGRGGRLFDSPHAKVWPRKYARWFGRAGRGEIRPHDLRRTFGSWLAMAGVPLTSISRLLGHASIETTVRHYAHLTPEFLAASTSNMRYHTRLHNPRSPRRRARPVRPGAEDDPAPSGAATA